MLSADAFFQEQAMRTLAHVLYGGADIGECMKTMSRIPPGDKTAWHREWTLTADRVASIGDACSRSGHDVSAREAYLRASNYYRTSYLMHYGAPTAQEVLRGFERESSTFQAFASRSDPPLEPVEIPYEGTTLPGYFCRADGAAGHRGTLIATNGYDSTVHEMYFAFAAAATRRGYNCLLFDGPGQGRVLIQQGLTFRPDWEHVLRAVMDFVLPRPDVESTRVALAGWSFGGYLALRAAGSEHRLAACIADPGLSGLWEPLQAMLSGLPAQALAQPLEADPSIFAPFMAQVESSTGLYWKIVQRAFWAHGVRSLPEYVDLAKHYTNDDAIQSIRCPVFLAWEESDVLARGVPDIFARLRAPKTLARFLDTEGAGDHCAMMARSLFHQRMFDWLDDVLGAVPAPAA